MKPPFSLIPTRGSSDTRKCVNALHQGVEADQVIGLAYVVMYQHRNYETHLCGEAARSPTFTLGAVRMLGRKLERRIEGK